MERSVYTVKDERRHIDQNDALGNTWQRNKGVALLNEIMDHLRGFTKDGLNKKRLVSANQWHSTKEAECHTDSY